MRLLYRSVQDLNMIKEVQMTRPTGTKMCLSLEVLHKQCCYIAISWWTTNRQEAHTSDATVYPNFLGS